MRIDLHVRSSEATQTNRSTGSNGPNNGKSAAADKAAVLGPGPGTRTRCQGSSGVAAGPRWIAQSRDPGGALPATARAGGAGDVQRRYSAGRSVAPQSPLESTGRAYGDAPRSCQKSQVNLFDF